MKCVAAIIRPARLDAVREALSAVGVNTITVSEVKGFGGGKGHTERYRGVEYAADFLPRIKLEAVVPDDRLERCLEALMGAARTGKQGDGKIFISSVDTVIRIRTGEHDAEAI